MAATVIINRLIGSGPTACAITSGSCRVGTEDSNVSPCAIPVPSSGSNYSFWVVTQLQATAAPDNAINNIKWYSDGTNSFGTGVDAIVTTASTYVQATGTAGSSGSILSLANYATMATGGTSPLFMYATGCRLTVAGSIAATTGSFGDRVVYQLNVVSTAGAGNTSEETFVWTWDES